MQDPETVAVSMELKNATAPDWRDPRRKSFDVVPPASGFNCAVRRFPPEAVSAHIELQKGERSELAELAANIL